MRAVVVLSLMLVVACETTQSIAPTAGQATTIDVRAGDHVRVLAKDGKRTSFDVTAVEAEALVGTTRKIARGDPTVEGVPARVAYADIAFLERHRTPNAAENAMTVAGTIAMITFIGAAVSGVALLPPAIPPP